MYPANQYIDPYYSHCRDHAPYLYCPPPGWEAGHPQMAMDSAYRSPSYGPWLCSANMNHSHPPEFHSCCNQTYSPGYYSFRPPVPHELPPPHLYCHGPFPHHPNAYPSYFVPSPPYPVDHTPYGYDKLKSHCCGCSNHVCHGEEKSSLKIEEERPEVKPESELNGVDNSSMIRHLNHQYPVIWLPPGNMKDRDNGRSFELPPQLLSRSVPQNGEKTGDVKQHEQDSEKKKQFQWPIIWMPTGYNEPKQEAKEFKEVDENPKVSGEAPPSPKIKIIPLSWFENDHHAQNPAAKDGPGDHNEASLLTNQSLSTEHRDGTPVDGNFKTIPVVPKKPDNENKPVGQNYKTIPAVPVKRSDEKKVGTCRTIPVLPQKESDGKKTELSENKEEKKTNNAEKEGDHGKRNNIESSKARHSKLPPVCLRVDPLPRKKSGNGSSRSLSPPTRKDAGKDKKDVKEAQSQNKETKLSDPKKESNVSVVKVKSPDETHKSMASMGATVQAASVKHTQEEQTPTSMDDQKVQPSVDVEAQENAGAKILQGCDKSTKENECVIQGEAPKSARRDGINLSESDAAVRIQSAYRGYYIRRWQPLEKLRKINEVHEQIQGVKKQMQRLEASSKQPTVKEQVPVNETIMNLLLKLDTIQGLHPSVREARKSVARELICLQEKLDSLCKQPSGEPNHTKSEEEKPERFENDIQTTAHVSKEETCEDEKYATVGEKQEPSLINSKELVHDEVISGVSMELRQDPDPSGQRHQMEESCTTKEAAHDEGKVEAAPDGCKGGASTDVMHDAALSGHSIEQEHQVEESNANSSEESPEEKSAAKGEDQGESSLDYMEPLHGAILSEGTNFPKKCTTSTEHDSHTQESNTGVSPAATEDGTTAMATASLGSGVAFDKGGSVEGQDRQVRESAAVESSELKHDVVPAEEDQCKEPSAPFVHLDDSSLSLEDSESHEHDPVVYDPEDQAEDRDANMQKQVSDATKDSMEDQDGTAEPSVGHTNKLNHVIAADVETSQSDSALEPTVLEESEVTNQCEKFGKADSALVDQQNEPHVENPTGGSAIGEVPLTVASEKEAETKENTLNAAGSLNNRGAERTLHESKSSELPCEHDGTRVHENTNSVESMKNDAQKKLADGDETSLVMGAVECNEMLKEAPVQADNPKEDAGMQIDSEEVASVSATHDGLKNDDEKNLAEENQKLKEMLQNLLACGNDQMGAISELSEKVKTLERKLARKRRPKVRVNRPARKTTAKVH